LALNATKFVGEFKKDYLRSRKPIFSAEKRACCIFFNSSITVKLFHVIPTKQHFMKLEIEASKKLKIWPMTYRIHQKLLFKLLVL
jgi:hypothetical protein